MKVSRRVAVIALGNSDGSPSSPPSTLRTAAFRSLSEAEAAAILGGELLALLTAGSRT